MAFWMPFGFMCTDFRDWFNRIELNQTEPNRTEPIDIHCQEEIKAILENPSNLSMAIQLNLWKQ